MFERMGLNANARRTARDVNLRWKQLVRRVPAATLALVACLLVMIVVMASQGVWGSFRLSSEGNGSRMLSEALGISFSAVGVYGNLFVVRRCPDLIRPWRRDGAADGQ
jgi:hypothetical protein